jgi:hypothetical protein
MSFFAIAARLAVAGVLAVLNVYPSQALARAADLTKTINCTGVPATVETTTVAIDLERFSIPAQWSDPGSQYEIVTDYVIEVYPNPGSQAVVCKSDGNWGTRDYDMLNVWTGNWWNYPLQLRLVINNFPVQGYAWFNVFMTEEDTGFNADDGLDLNPYPIYGNLEFNIYPASGRAYFLRWDVKGGREIQDSTGMVVFGRSKRFIGAGDGKGRHEDVAASIDIKMSAGDAILPPGIAGEGTMPAPPKVGGAVPAPGNKGPNLPSPGQQVLDKEQICRNYALQAVEWNQIAQQLQCPGLFPPVWSNDHQMHFDWCMQGDNASTTAFHNNQRAWAIQTCRGN